MAGKAEFRPLRNQTVRIRRTVRIVTRHAVPHSHRTVNFLFAGLVLDVTLIAEFARRFGLQSIAVRRLMGIMAGGTETKANRSVDNLLDIEPPFVTEIAKLPFLAGHPEAMFPCIIHRLFLDRYMTADALPHSHRTMDVSLFCKIVVAPFVKARPSRCTGSVGDPDRDQHEYEKSKGHKA